LPAGQAVEIAMGGKTYVVGVKNDLRKDMARDNKRPRYVYEAGRLVFGGFETNGDFLFAASDGKKMDYTIVNLTKALYRRNPLIETKPWYSGLAFDGGPDSPERGKLRYWRGEVSLK
jgi:hypothetical protein